MSHAVLLCFGFVLSAPRPHAQSEIVRFQRVFPNLTFEFPIGLTYANDDTNYLYVPEYVGRIRVFENNPDVDTAYVFLDLRKEVNPGGESGEFYDGIFHPNYEENGYFFVYYFIPSPRQLMLVRYTRSTSNPLIADPASRLVLLEIPTPGPQNHHGGKMAFGPDGYLYLPIGDGGSWADELGHGQDRSTLLGSLVRIDVDQTSQGMNYAIPADNPFVGNTDGWREEIWAYGFRNPYSSSFDLATGQFWVGDVGEISWEEINVVEVGGNYGWNVMEGSECFEDMPCNPSDYSLPFYAYPHMEGSPSSVIGGTVYWGSAIPELRGHYIFGDFFNKLWSLDFSDPDHPNVELLAEPFNIVAIGQDKTGELYSPKFFNGEMTMLVPMKGSGSVSSPQSFPSLVVTVRPNPFRTSTSVRIVAGKAGFYRIALYDILGREVRTVFEGELASDQSLSTPIDAAGLSAGTYVVVVDGEEDAQAVRLTRIQ